MPTAAGTGSFFFLPAMKFTKGGARRSEAFPVEVDQHTAGRDGINVKVQQNLRSLGLP